MPGVTQVAVFIFTTTSFLFFLACVFLLESSPRKASKTMASRIEYSEKYQDDSFEYR